ncbi:MAG: hypothetical protein V4473_01440 [Patescibacteria group bacterium]
MTREKLMKKLPAILSLIFLLCVYVLPMVAFGVEDTSKDYGIAYVCNGECTFADVIGAIKKVINFGIEFALFFSVIVIARAGFIYMTSGGSPGERAKANEMFRKVAVGIFLALAAWLIVTLITSALLRDDAYVKLL